MQPLRSTDLLEVLDRAREMHAIDRALAILAFASPGLSWDELAALPLGERNRRLLALRAATFGPRLDIVSRCPACGEAHELEFVFPLGELPAIAPGEVSGTFEGRELRVRLPDSRDLAAAANARDAEAARRVLLERCAPGAGSSEALAAAFSALVEAHDPLAEIAFSLTCTSCGRAWRALLDPVEFVWREIEQRARILIREVHALASAYGWTEGDVLALSPARRRLYLEQVGG